MLINFILYYMYQFYKKHVWACMVMMALLAGLQQASAQASLYPFTQSQGTFTPLEDAMVIIESSSLTGDGSIDSQKFQLPDGTIPFAFTFGGSEHTGLWVYADGFITFGPTSIFGSTPISNSNTATPVDGAISALANSELHGLYVADGPIARISYKVVGVAPNREFVIEWLHLRPYSSFVTANLFDWSTQIRLKEDNSINIVYDLKVTGTPTSSNVQVGLRGATNSDYNNRAAGGTASNKWISTMAGGSNASTVTCNSSSLPPSGYTFTWTPPAACAAPTAQPTAFSSTITSGVIVSGSFTAPTPAANKYLVLRTAEGTTPNAPANGTTYTTGDNEALNARVVYAGPNTTFTDNGQTGVIGNTKYVYTIYAYNDLCLGVVSYNTQNPLLGNITTCPGPINTVSTSAINASSFTINWEPNNGTALAMTYSIEVSTSSTFATQVTGSPFTVNAPDTSFPVTGLDPGTMYYFRLRAITSCGNGNLTSVRNVTTNCLPQAVISENFNTTSASALPSCWAKIIRGTGTTSSTTVGVSTSNGINGGAGMALYNANAITNVSGVDVILASAPLSNITAGTHRLRFKARKGSATINNNLQIGTLSDNSAAGVFTALGTVTELTSAYKEYTVYFTGYTGTDAIIGFRHTSESAQSYAYIDDVVWEPIPACLSPLNIAATAIFPTTATISWNFDAFAAAPANGYEYYVSTNNQVPSVTDHILTTGEQSINLTNLASGTNFYVFVRSACSDTDKSTWTSVAFKTRVATPVVWTEPFATTATPAEWLTTGWTIGATRGAVGNPGTNIYKNLFGTTPTGSFTTIAVGPLPASSDLSFDYNHTNWNSPYGPVENWGKFVVEVSTNFGTSWAPLATVENEAGDGSYIPKTYSLSAYENQYVMVRITGTRTNGDFILSFDNFKIAGQPVSAVPVESVAVTTFNNVAPAITLNQGTLQLVGSILPAEANQGVSWSISQGVGYATISTSGLVTAIVNGTVTARATSIVDATKFGEIQITITNQVPVYCQPGFSQGVEPITLVEFAGINSPSSNVLGSPTPVFEDFTTMIGQVTQGQSYDIRLKGNTDGSQSSYFKVYVDWNQNGTFEASEGTDMGYINNSTGLDDKELIKPIDVPANAIPGQTRMRVLKKWASSTIDGCNTTGYGQAEDYTLNVTEAAAGTGDFSKTAFTVYPNPSTDVITIQSAESIENISVYSVTGQVVRNTKSATVNVNDLTAGVYILNITFAKGSTATAKVVKK